MNFKLRHWQEGDAPSIANYANNPKIAANLRDAFPSPYTLADAKAFALASMNADETAGLQRVIEVNGEAAGSVAITLGSDVYHKTAELGYWLAEPYWGKGIMSGAIRQACTEAFEKYGIVRIYAEPFARNMASRRALEKAGFTLESVLRQNVCKDGVVQDSCMYALLRG